MRLRPTLIGIGVIIVAASLLAQAPAFEVASAKRNSSVRPVTRSATGDRSHGTADRTLMKFRSALVGVGSAVTVSLTAQAPTDRHAFEVASIKPNHSDPATSPARVEIAPGDRVALRNLPLALVIGIAYQRNGFARVIGTPDWTRTERFDINAKATGPASLEQLRVMLETLLVDRCHMVVHHEAQDAPIYALVLRRQDGTLGPGIRPAGDCTELNPDQAARPANPCGTSFSPRGVLRVRGRDMNQFAILRPIVGRRVVDRTGLRGRFDIDLTWTPQDPAGRDDATSLDANAPTIFTAIQEQLGLKLVADKDAEDVVVIDHIERPSEN